MPGETHVAARCAQPGCSCAPGSVRERVGLGIVRPVVRSLSGTTGGLPGERHERLANIQMARQRPWTRVRPPDDVASLTDPEGRRRYRRERGEALAQGGASAGYECAWRGGFVSICCGLLFPSLKFSPRDSGLEGVVGHRFVDADEGKIGLLAIDVPRFRLWEV